MATFVERAQAVTGGNVSEIMWTRIYPRNRAWCASRRHLPQLRAGTLRNRRQLR